jgi:hypothetical protein
LSGKNGGEKMQGSPNIIGRPSKRAKLVNGLKQYLRDARSNPGLKLSILAICRAIDVQKSTIYLHQNDPEVAELLKSVRALASARKLAAIKGDDTVDSEDSEKAFRERNIDPTNNSELISLELLTVNSASAVQKAVWCMNRFIGRHRKHLYVSDLPRIVFDLDTTLAQLHRIREDLNSISNKWLQMSLQSSEPIDADAQLSFPPTVEG